MEKNAQLNHDDINLQPVSTTEVITDKKEDFPLDTLLIGIQDVLKYISDDVKVIDRWRAESKYTLNNPVVRQISGSDDTFLIKTKNYQKGTNPSNAQYNCIYRVIDKTNTRLLNNEYIIYTSGTSEYKILIYDLVNNTTANGQVNFGQNRSADFYVSFNVNKVMPYTDNSTKLGDSSNRWKEIFAATATINTSDERLKDDISEITEDVLDAWSEVNWCQFRFKDAVEAKKNNARIHNGLIAQRIQEVFESHGLDVTKYGLFCYDEWEAIPEERDSTGNVTKEAMPAGNRYSLRYEECLAMEAAYQRRRADKLEERIKALEEKMNLL